MFFPALWASGEHLWSITQATYAKFYDTILLPSIRHVSAVSAAHWPISYSSAMNHARDARGHYHYQTLDVNYTDLVELETQLLERMDQDATFKGAFWEHELRGTKDATGHEFEDVDAHRDRFESFISILNMDRVVPAEWCVDVAVEISIAGFNVAWLTVAHSRILAYALPDVHPDHLTAISRNKSKFTSDVVAHLDGVAGCRVDPGRYCGSDGVSYINVYTTDKSNTYQQWLGSFARIRTAALLPKGIKALLRSMSIMGEAFAACRTTSCRAGDISQDGHARFEVRVPIANALTAMTRNMDDLIGHAVICIPNQTWWSVVSAALHSVLFSLILRHFKFLRMAALNYVIENLDAASFTSRCWLESLALGANAVYMINALIYRPSSQRLETILRDASSQRVMSADGVVTPIGAARGLYFLADVVFDKDVYRLPRLSGMSPETISQMYGCQMLLEVELFFAPVQQPRPQRRANVHRIQNRFTMSTQAAVIRDVDEVAAVDFHLAERGAIIRPQLAMQGPDIVSDNDDDDNAPALNSLDVRVSTMWAQFTLDIIRKAPNKKDVSDPSYLLLTHEERRLASDDVFKTTALPFTHACYRVVDNAMWGKAFDNYFPVDPTARTGPTQNFGSVLYRSEWSVIVSQLGVDSRTTVRRELKRKFDDFIWIPYASDRIWATTPQRGKIWRQLPEGPRVCAPHLYVNPRFAHKHFTLRAASNEIGEDSDVDST